MFKPGSAFTPDEPETSLAISQLTAAILGMLISEQVIKLDSRPGETLEYIDRRIYDTIEENMYRMDMIELQRVHDQARAARFAK